MVRGELLDPDLLAEAAQANEEIYGFFGVSVFAAALRSLAEGYESHFGSEAEFVAHPGVLSN